MSSPYENIAFGGDFDFPVQRSSSSSGSSGFSFFSGSKYGVAGMKGWAKERISER